MKRSSPTTHAARIKVPVFSSARDDDKVTSEEWRNFGRAVTDAGGQAEIKTVATRGHYQSMIDEAFPPGSSGSGPAFDAIPAGAFRGLNRALDPPDSVT